MFRIFFFVNFLLPIICVAQFDPSHLRKKSNETFAYKINTALAEKYIKEDSINVDNYLPQEPFLVFNSDSINEDQLPRGHYVLLNVQDNLIVANLLGVSDLYPYTINNRQQVQLFIRNRNGEFITNAETWIASKSIGFNRQTNSFWITNKHPDEAIIKIYTLTDTTFISLMAEDELDKSVSEQKWHNLLHSKIINLITWLPKNVLAFFKPKKSYPLNNIGAKGTMIFNQPKYKITDTVKLKAYVVNKHWKRYNKSLKVFLSYYANGKRHEQYLSSLNAQHAGSFIYNFPLSDTLNSDNTYKVVLKTPNGKNIFSGSFKIEDYLTDKVTNCKLRSSNKSIYSGDTLHLYASATDANGLSLLDARAVLVLTTKRIGDFFKNGIQVPDTLFIEEKKLFTEGETDFDIPTSNFPDANLEISANVTFKNSNNEVQDKDVQVEYRPGNKEISAGVDIDTIRAEYRLNGKSKTAKGLVIKKGETGEEKQINYPFKVKIDPMADGYSFYVIDRGIKTDSIFLSIKDHYDVYFNRISLHDTIGFELFNSKKLPVTFSIWDGNALIAAKTSESEIITWLSADINRHKIYTVKWQYYYGGEEQTKQEDIALLHKLLNIKIQSNKTVFPGQSDTIAIDVKDYKDRPVANVNLTALSYNNQFGKDIIVREPPYLVKYRKKSHIIRDKFEEYDGYILKKYSLGKHKQWITKFGLDSMPYYRALFPGKDFTDLATPISSFGPQVSVHVVKQGIRQTIYLLYINRNLVYFNGVTDYSKDAHAVYPGLTQLGIRLFDQFISLDSLYLQPFYKHDLFIDLDHLAKDVHTEMQPNYFSVEERNLLENSLWLVNNNYRTNGGYIWQDNKSVHFSGNHQHIVGPFSKNDSLHFYAPVDFDVHFKFETGYEYDLSPKIYRLEKKKCFCPVA